MYWITNWWMTVSEDKSDNYNCERTNAVLRILNKAEIYPKIYFQLICVRMMLKGNEFDWLPRATNKLGNASLALNEIITSFRHQLLPRETVSVHSKLILMFRKHWEKWAMLQQFPKVYYSIVWVVTNCVSLIIF